MAAAQTHTIAAIKVRGECRGDVAYFDQLRTLCRSPQWVFNALLTCDLVLCSFLRGCVEKPFPVLAVVLAVRFSLGVLTCAGKTNF
jgi:hypothetical protein